MSDIALQPAAKPRKAKPSRAAPDRTAWLQGAVFAAVVTLATPTAVFAAILLLPSLMAAIADPTPGRPVGRAVLLYGLAAAAPEAAALWRHGNDIGTALRLALDVPTLAWCWAAQAGGWLLTQALPLVIHAALDARAARQAAALEKLKAAHEAEWE